MQREADEEALMEAYVEGDEEAFERLFRSLAPSIHAFFARSVGRGGVAEDLLQTTFLKLHAARGSWRRGERLRPWVFTIAARVRVDWFRSQGRSERELAGDGAPEPDPRSDPDPAEAVLAEERAERVRAALDSLPEPQRLILHLHRFEGLTFGEIGDVLGISEGAARLRAFRGYARLRSLLAELVSAGGPEGRR